MAGYLMAHAPALLAAAGGALGGAGAARAFSCSAAAAGKKVWFSHVEMAPRDPILGVTEKFLADKAPNKINLGVGAYRDDNGQPVVLDCVREAERKIAGSGFMEYLPIGGLRDFVTESVKLAYGDACPDLSTIAAVQSLSGTGSCRLMADFQRRFMPHSQVYIPVPTWSNHHNIWKDAGVPQAPYRYYKPATKGLDFEGLMEDVKAAPSGSLFLLHACAHNPTGAPGRAAAAPRVRPSSGLVGGAGPWLLATIMTAMHFPDTSLRVDPTPEQWAEISKLMLEKAHFPFFDMAYQVNDYVYRV
ncbi:aspartate aminotransferase [Monoraphidium neglectum]|uniref:Aspartate aminotransferase n=1 Tax=Monoraphidium neglectum TaxID=145388 RepID=A0A0D2LYH1_9CHLO|nr:aspartate aminotransferase [Monoraphidium neglectum]KIY94496.1 aspartate aminotransferase [Monoraphidium neglectum]|eukprot:XP_013893516.1 aspartate aminotransferase [Monoraphidium neglectum]